MNVSVFFMCLFMRKCMFACIYLFALLTVSLIEFELISLSVQAFMGWGIRDLMILGSFWETLL